VGSFALQNGIPIPFTSQERPADEIPEANTPSEMFALRRRMKPSRQSLSPEDHAGLGLDLYVQATSPLRRYLDLVVHQQIRAHVTGQELLGDQQIIEAIGATEAIRGNVRWAERRSNQHWTLVYLLQNPAWQGCGQVIDKFGQRTLVLLPELALETSMYLRREVPLDGHIDLAFQEANLPLLEAYFQEV
jgi:exoribonuclease-2